LKIGIISREYPPLTHIGGIATFSAATAQLLASHGHEVHVVCNGLENETVKELGITVHRVKMLPHHFKKGRAFYPYRNWFRKNLPHYLDALTWAKTVAQFLNLRFKDEKFDLWEFPETGG
jgi:glycogen synthase